VCEVSNKKKKTSTGGDPRKGKKLKGAFLWNWEGASEGGKYSNFLNKVGLEREAAPNAGVVWVFQKQHLPSELTCRGIGGRQMALARRCWGMGGK